MWNVKNQYTFLFSWDHSDPIVIREKSLVHQIQNVLRISEGENLLLLNGQGQKLLVKVQKVEKAQILCSRIAEKSLPQEKTSWHLVLGAPKKEALKEVLRFGTQLGVSVFHIFHAQYSQVKVSQYEEKYEHFLGLIKESLEQSQRLYLPGLHMYESYKAFKERCSPSADEVFVADLADPQGPPGRGLLEYDLVSQNDIYLVIGPEGGWSPQEREGFSGQAHFYTLSPYILRLQTAAIASLVVAQTILNVRTPDGA